MGQQAPAGRTVQHVFGICRDGPDDERRCSHLTPAGAVAPPIHSQLLAAVVIGPVVSGHWPDGPSLSGLAVIALAGVAPAWIAGRGRQCGRRNSGCQFSASCETMALRRDRASVNIIPP